jgi:hypothetical protein
LRSPLVTESGCNPLQTFTRITLYLPFSGNGSGMVAHSRKSHIFNWLRSERILCVRSTLACCPRPKLSVVAIVSGQPTHGAAKFAGLKPHGRTVPAAPFSGFRLCQYDNIKIYSFLMSPPASCQRSLFIHQETVFVKHFFAQSAFSFIRQQLLNVAPLTGRCGSVVFA